MKQRLAERERAEWAVREGRGGCAGEIVALRGLLIRKGVEDGMRILGEPEREREDDGCLGGLKKGIERVHRRQSSMVIQHGILRGKRESGYFGSLRKNYF